MSLTQIDVKADAVKCRIKILNDPTKQGKSWLREVMTQAAIFGAEETITLKWVAIETIDLTQTTADAGVQSSTVSARGLGIMPQVKIEGVSSIQEEKRTQEMQADGEMGAAGGQQQPSSQQRIVMKKCQKGKEKSTSYEGPWKK